MHFKHEQSQDLLIESQVTIGTIQQTQDPASVLWYVAEMSGLWNFSVRVQSWSAKIESDPVLIREMFENHQSDPVLIRPCKIVYFILLHEATALLELFCLWPNTIGCRQNISSSALASWWKTDTAFQNFKKFNKTVSTLPLQEKALLELFCHSDNPIGWIGLLTRPI